MTQQQCLLLTSWVQYSLPSPRTPPKDMVSKPCSSQQASIAPMMRLSVNLSTAPAFGSTPHRSASRIRQSTQLSRTAPCGSGRVLSGAVRARAMKCCSVAESAPHTQHRSCASDNPQPRSEARFSLGGTSPRATSARTRSASGPLGGAALQRRGGTFSARVCAHLRHGSVPAMKQSRQACGARAWRAEVSQGRRAK